MIIKGQLNKEQFAEMQKALKNLELSERKKQRFLWRMAKHGVIAAAKRNVKKQQSPDGRAWKARQSHYKKKMLRNMPKLLHIREIPETDSVRIYLRGGNYHSGGKKIRAGIVGFTQQYGMKTTIRKRDVQSKKMIEREATKKQAKKLRDLGYQIKSGKRWKKPTVRHICESMNMGQAGLLIRKLSEKPPKNTWSINVPSRVFLGMSDNDFKKALARQLQGIEFGADIKAQDMK
ncbi:hypothetical protein HMPREF1562_2271 [Providencia alcalifaciens F90-2004]|uniref:hypothetical protein n=1 Tax=Providencia alcalifaciens TaxID=126385 RepID=UPI00044E02CD|nr:hypothetical protein [Providencia alcalifaciens]ETT04951.1 hypothetical protein HMPREF1562_2271 [Providencia alcalifaciens F90-2004]